MPKSYIHVYKHGNSIQHTYIEDGQRKFESIKYQPLLAYQSNERTEWKDVHGNYLKPRLFESMSEAHEWKEANKKMFDVYGDIKPEVAFIAENYVGDLIPQKQLMNIYALDIECFGSNGFPKSENPDDVITVVTFLNMVTKHYYVFGLADFEHKRKDVSYYRCNNEKHLLLSIIDFFNRQDIDIITGWYSTAFDIPYIVERIELVIGQDESKKLSPTRKLRKGHKIVNKREVTVYDIQGIISLDYLDLYQKFTFEMKESYQLDFIAKAEGVGQKLEFKEEYSDLNTLWLENPQRYVEYNIMDVELIDNLDKKLKFIDLAISYAYMMKCDISNIFGTVGPWDALLYSELRNKGVLVPPLKVNKLQEYPGGFVAEPIKGRVRWTSVFDIVSSYPNTICSYNISPDTIVDRRDVPYELQALIDDMENIEDYYDVLHPRLEEITNLLKKYNLCLCANGTVYTTERMGFLTDIVGRIFNDRKKVKNQIKELKKRGPIDGDVAQYEIDLGVLENRSQVLKIAVNSVYGALANIHFRFFDIRLASAITSSAQVSNRGVTRYITTKIPDISLVYGDTDSNFLSFEKLVAKRFPDGEPDPETVTKFILKFQDKILEPVIGEFFEVMGDTYNMYQRTIQMEAECIADTSIFLEKKKYAMHQLWKEGDWYISKPKLKIKGIEVVRSSTPAVVRAKLKEALGLIFESDNDTLIEFVENFKKDFYLMSFDSVAFPRGVNFYKDAFVNGEEVKEEYTLQSKSLPIAVRASLIFNRALEEHDLTDKYLPITSGSKIKFCYIKLPNKFRSDVLGMLTKMPDEFKPLYQIDYDTQWEKAFAAPLSKITDTIGWHIEQVATLEDFFS